MARDVSLAYATSTYLTEESTVESCSRLDRFESLCLLRLVSLSALSTREVVFERSLFLLS